MSITQATFDNLSRALTDLKLPSLGYSQAELLVEHTGIPKLQNLIAGARVSEEADRNELEQRVIAVRAHYAFLELGLKESSLRSVMAAISTHGVGKLRLTMGDAMKGDQSAKAILGGWLQQAANLDQPDLSRAAAEAAVDARSGATSATASNGPHGPSRAPIHPTTMAPPAPRSLPVERAASQPARPAEQRPAQGSSQAPVAAERVAQGNVRPIRAPASRHDTDFAPEYDDVPQAAPRDVAPKDGRQYDQVCVFGRDRVGATALQFDCSPAPADNGGRLTINLSLARAKGAKTQDGVDWMKKIVLMLSPGECGLCLNVLMGVNREFRGAGHGQGNKKWFQMTESEGDYAGSIFVTVAQGDDQRGCSIMPGDLFAAICIFQRAVLAQTKAEQSNIEPLSMRDIMRRVGAMQDLARNSEKARKEKRARA
jgi:hypothetical protein